MSRPPNRRCQLPQVLSGVQLLPCASYHTPRSAPKRPPPSWSGVGRRSLQPCSFGCARLRAAVFAAARWLGEIGVAGVGSDNYGVEVVPTEHGDPAPVHRMLIRDYGVYLLELLVLDELAADRRFEFMFVAAPLLITGGTGSPINPLAIV